MKPFAPYPLAPSTCWGRRLGIGMAAAVLWWAGVPGSAAAQPAPAAASAAAPQLQLPPVEGLIAAAHTTLQLLDAGNAAQVWQAATADFRQGVTQANFGKVLKDVRQKTGPLVARQWAQATAQRLQQPGKPDMPILSMAFASRFASQPATVETVQFRLDGGQWRFNGYRINILPPAAPAAAAPAPAPRP